MEAQAGKLSKLGADDVLLCAKSLGPGRGANITTQPENLAGSGIDIVINQCIFAIIGAIALEKGSATASRIVREKIFKRTHGFS